jgi:mRNA interferase RelE/StbE
VNWSGNLAWLIRIAEIAQKDIRKLDRKVQSDIIRFLRERIELAVDPRQTGKALKGDFGELWRYRLGDYRIICDIQDLTVTILVLRVRHRKDVYRRSR